MIEKILNQKKRFKLFVLLLTITFSVSSTNYYFDGNSGDDAQDGLTQATAWKSLSKVAALTLQPGDSVLLKRGTVFANQNIVLEAQNGSLESPIAINAFGEGEKPVIDCGSNSYYGIVINASQYIHVENIEITGGNGGIFFTWIDQTIEFKHFVFRNLYIHDVYKANGTAFSLNNKGSKDPKRSEYTDVQIMNCRSEMIGRQFIKADGLRDLVIKNNNFSHSGGPGIVIHHSVNVEMIGNTVSNSGSRAHSIFYGRGSCAWILNVRNILVERNIFENAQGWLDSYGFHLDIGNNNVVVQHNLSRNNAGGFAQILGKNKNSAYRYNISINDGWRVKGVLDHPTEKNLQDGCVISLNGYVVNGNYVGPENTYIYNNTVYVKDDITACWNFRYTIKGVFIANNVFHIMGASKNITGKKNANEPAGSFPENIIFKNNLYLKDGNLPSNMLINDTEKLIGDAQFVNPGGEEASDYIPGNANLIENKSIEIVNLPGDIDGLGIGFKVDKDYFGNEIVDTPDLGAVELSQIDYPYANAGDDKSFLVIPDSVFFDGVAIDDIEITGVLWEKLSGPACTLVNPDSLLLVVKDLEEGDYTFRLTVSDSEGNNASDIVTLSVFCESCRTPIVTVSNSRVVQLPKDTINLQGNATVEKGTIASYLWEKISGPDLTISGASTHQITLGNLLAGAYTFRLTATSSDNIQSFNEVSINILPTADSIPKANNPWLIDGIPEEALCGSLFKIDKPIKGFSNSYANAGLAWDENHLYVYVAAEDKYLMHDSENEWWDDDAIELLIDADNSKGNTFGAKDFRYGFRWHWNESEMDMFEPKHNATTGVVWKLMEVKDGYNLEAAIPWTTLNHTPSVGDKIGIEIRLLIDDDGFINDAIKALYGFSGEAVPTPSQFGTLILGEKCISLSNSKNQILPEFKLYPVITDGMIYIDNNNTFSTTYIIRDITGKIISEQTFNNSTVINLNSKSPGLYFITLKQNDHFKTFKIIRK